MELWELKIPYPVKTEKDHEREREHQEFDEQTSFDKEINMERRKTDILCEDNGQITPVAFHSPLVLKTPSQIIRATW